MRQRRGLVLAMTIIAPGVPSFWLPLDISSRSRRSGNVRVCSSPQPLTPKKFPEVLSALAALLNFRKELLGRFIGGETIAIADKYPDRFKLFGVGDFGSGTLTLVTDDRRIRIKGIRKNRNFNRMERNLFDVRLQRGTMLLFFDRPEGKCPSLNEH